MKKFKIIYLSLILAFGFGFTVQMANVQAAENLEPVVSQAADEIFVTRTVPFTHAKSMWVTETRNGKTYSGYIYNRGFADGTGNYSFFSGYILAGPYAPMATELE
ncbi:hypothetical protein [Sporosarcina sp. Te-1]|uniref:hypothetical protein n=1 Tax=Sporosarcina sp. Te-1 TaxID=2818390 RepID=UPI001A9DBAF8|nr:hypothetical protein [Sporosarcina sp. Te-1]QTD40024.1 hypothetical protein J3U78_14480 [Sporosarcina sp. Te-1]